MLIIRRINCIDAASGIVTLTKWPSGAQDERELWYTLALFYITFIIILYMFRANFVLIIRRSNFTNTASCIVTLSKWPSGAQVEREL